MKTNNTSSTSRLLRFVSAGALALGLTATAFAQGTAFTYQGRLTDGVNPATGIYDLSFTLYDSAGGAGTVGRPVPKLGVGVTNGLFTVALEFGAGLFNGAALWLEIAAKTNGASVYVTLSPRQPLTPAPYALYAPAAGSVPAAGLIGMLPDAHLSANVALLDSSPVFDGSVTAADELVGLRLQIGVACEAGPNLATIAGGLWNTNNGYQSFLGQGISNTIQTNSERVFLGGGTGNTIERNADDSFLGGGSGNTIRSNANGAVLGGGLQNTILTNADYATLGGGYQNTNGGDYATVPGGQNNTALGAHSLAAGFRAKANHPGAFVWADSTLADFASTDTNQFLIRASGGVGLNTNDPAGAALNVAGNVRAAQFQGGGAGLTGTIPADNSVTSAKILNGAILTADLADNSVNAAKIADGSVTSLKIADNAVAAVDLASEESSLNKVSGGHMTVTPAGNLGLGTATPVYPLDVQAAQAVGRFLSTNSASVSFLELGNTVASALWLGAINFSSSNTTPGQIAYATDSGLTFRAGGAERLRITPAGSVGIGTNDPAGAALNVAGTVRALLFQGSGASLIGLNASQVTIGTLPDSRLPANVVRTNQVWLLSGNAGTTTGGQFLGTTDAEPLEFKVDNHRALRLEPIANTTLLRGIVNLVGGSAANLVADGTYGGTIGGGGAEQYVASAYPNRVSANFGTVAGGLGNSIGSGAFAAAIGGGWRNTIQTNADAATIGGGSGNQVSVGAESATIGGGTNNEIQTNASAATIGGGSRNAISNAFATTIGGGQDNVIRANSQSGTIGGGSGNAIGTNCYFSTISGGWDNEIGDATSTIGGGTDNAIGTGSMSSTIGGGGVNKIGTDSNDSTIGGGASNHIRNASLYSTISGGGQNHIGSESPYSTISGGVNNEIGTNSYSSTIGGGENNAIGTNSIRSTIGGGNANRIGDNASYAAIPGGYGNSATSHAFAAGRRAKANHTGAFVWADSTDVDLASLAANSMTLRAAGGVRFFSNSGATLGVSLAAGGTSWGVISDRNAKKNFQPVDSRAVLEKLAQMPVERWNYKAEADDSVPHLGPMAQDFKAAFYPGRDETSISTLEFDGVALAAIQGLNQKLEAKNAALEQEMAELKTLVKALAEKVNGGGR